ncbi:hypothetical protein [Endozoicomonas sp. 2B-B]
MSAKPKPEPQSTEINHIRNTLTDVVDGFGQTRGEMHQRFDQQDKEIAALRADNVEIKEMLKALISRQ